MIHMFLFIINIVYIFKIVFQSKTIDNTQKSSEKNDFT